MKIQITKIAQAAALGLALAFTLSCSGDGDNGGNASIKKGSITGVSQKGPFVKGSSAVLYELNNDLSQTGRTFQDIIADDYGKFEIKGVELVSPYAMLKATGNYRNEVTGNVSAAKIDLYAIADLTDKNNVNVNILTHLEYYRVLNLVEKGKGVREAKKQAQREILAVFGISGDFSDSEDMSIFGTSEGDAALLAISILLQSDLNEVEFEQRLTDFRLGFAENGVWSNEGVKTAMADWASSADLDGIKKNILAWGLSGDVPVFGKYVYGFWVGNYGLGECKQGKVKPNGNINGGMDYICKDGFWELAECNEAYNSEELNFIIDNRDGKHYRYGCLGSMTIMLDNLNYSKNNTLGYCYGVDIDGTNPHRDSTSCDNGYGRVYKNESPFLSLEELCPKGWRMPSSEEWEAIFKNPDWPNVFQLAGAYNTDLRYPPLGWADRDFCSSFWSSQPAQFAWYGYGAHRGEDLMTSVGAFPSNLTGFLSIRCVR